VADIGPEIEMQAFGNDFAAAEADHPGLRHSLVRAFGRSSHLGQAHLSACGVMS